MRRPSTNQDLPDQIATWLTLALVLLYTYGNFFALPYTGLYFIESSGRIVRVYLPSAVQPGDELVQVGAVRLEDFRRDAAPAPFWGLAKGSVVPLVVERDGQTLNVDWTMPGFTWGEFFNLRLSNQWWLSYVFWAIGALAVLGLRPRRRLQRLFAAFNFLTALWLIASVVSRWHLWLSPEVLRSAIWLSLPVYWHLHWVFPEPLRRLPRWVGGLLYGLAGLAALAEWLQLLPPTLYALALLLAPAGSLVFLGLHLLFQRQTRRAAFTLLAGAGLSLVPAIIIGVSSALLGLASEIALAGLLGLPLLPLTYLIAIYRHRFGGLELRVNRAISIYLFLVIVLLGLVLAGGALEAALPGDHGGLIVVVVLLVGLVGVLGAVFAFAPFQRWVERTLLGVPPTPPGLMETYASRIGTCLELPTLIRLLREEVLPALLIRQSALLCEEAGAWRSLYADGVAEADHPAAPLPALLAEAGRFRPPDGEHAAGSQWVRLALALPATAPAPSVWLLGKRDPDDFYAATELPVLQALANQVAVALRNIRQAADLHALYQADVDRAELERASLARELHDGPLNDLGRLAGQAGPETAPAEAQPDYLAAITSLRQTISGLRPVMLSFGLPAGLTGLAHALHERWPGGPQLALEAPMGPWRYPPQVETHAYRIAQQACANALRHAGATEIRLSAAFAADQLDLTIEDNGRGFEVGTDLTQWLARRHFGLAGMHERAALIGAALHVQSAPGQGTRVRLVWPAA